MDLKPTTISCHQSPVPSVSLLRRISFTHMTSSGRGGSDQLPWSGVSTLSVQGGEWGGRPNVADAMATPIVQTSTYFFKNTADLLDFCEGRKHSYEYGRYGNPTVRVAEEKLMALEGAEDCLFSASGMNSCTTMLLALVPDGGHIVTTTDCYRRTRQFMESFMPRVGVRVTVIDVADLDALRAALHTGNVSLFFSETPTNPYLRCVDIPLVASLCHSAGAIVCIDSTFATPFNCRPLALGSDLVLHSATKYLAGHNDVLAGALAGKKFLIEKVRKMHAILGGVIDPHAAYLVLRGMKTLGVRLQRHNETALALAALLDQHPNVERVHYPGLSSHPDYHVAKRILSGCGGVVSFEIRGGLHAASKFIDNLKIPKIAPSLGGVDSLVEQPTIISYWDKTPEERAIIGIRDGLVRFACGIEDTNDVLDDVRQALDAI